MPNTYSQGYGIGGFGVSDVRGDVMPYEIPPGFLDGEIRPQA